MKVMNAAALVLVVVSAAAEGCREELISFSACLAYVSYPPNNLTESASEKCCKAFSSAVESSCLCYVIRDPLFLGFPLNTTRLLSLSSLCPSPFSTSFPFLCSSGTSFFLLSSSSFLSSLSHLLLVLLLSQILLLYPLSPHHQLKPSELLLGPALEEVLLRQGHPFWAVEQEQFLMVTLLLQPSLHSPLSQHS
ncbi:hypothetical protein ACSQ67_002897 [Phaseolus vulgaris]